ncbi:ABC transporter ATP-binding protein [Methanobacterium formicicum]|uniref:Fe(3+)-transporting ATPase n=1 Tax=Methanobacterium formicicum (strain DSM 3637 / PP1) TaxID=1204725 RepID=K2RES0_METFP|nr:Fe(3+)-transporting ATPase [Methanobacterium formicicum DSM 3637]
MIKIDSLNKSFGRIRALENLNLEIEKGELLGIIGPNGAGKTTAIRIICCILQPDSGNVTVGGYSIYHDQIKIKSMIGYLPEEPNLYERFKARDLLKYFGELYGVPKNEINGRIDELLELVGMSHRADDQINTFSKGLRQRIGIARALIHDPEVIIFDEPTMGLDPATSRAIRNFIKELKGDKTVILCTHYMDEADLLCDRVAILNQGKIRNMGTPESLKEKIHGDIILQVRVNEPQKIQKDQILAFDSVEGVNLEGNQFLISLRSREDISSIIDIFGEQAISVNTKEPTLDDVFIQTTQ